MFIADSPEEEAAEYKKIGNESYKKLDFEKAIENFSKAIELQPGAKEYYSNRVLTLFKLSRYEEALVDCDSIKMLDSGWPKGLHLRGLALQQLGKNREAKSEFERLLQIVPNHKAAKERLGVINEILGEKDTEAGESRATTSTATKKKSKKAKQKNTNKEKKTDSQLHKQIENLRTCNGKVLTQLQEERAQNAKWKKKYENLEKQKTKKGGNKKNKNQGNKNQDGADKREIVRLTKLLEESEGKRKELEDENMNLRQQLNKFQGKKISKWNAEALFDMIDLHTNKLQTLNAESRRRFGKKSANSSKRKN